MKKKKIVSIKHPKLQQIRNNFRLLLVKIAQDRWFGIHNALLKLPKDDIKGAQILNSKKQELDNIVKNSICKCRRCVKTDRDMTYNPVDKAWYCVDCYKEMQRWTAKKKTGISLLFP